MLLGCYNVGIIVMFLFLLQFQCPCQYTVRLIADLTQRLASKPVPLIVALCPCRFPYRFPCLPVILHNTRPICHRIVTPKHTKVNNVNPSLQLVIMLAVHRVPAMGMEIRHAVQVIIVDAQIIQIITERKTTLTNLISKPIVLHTTK